MTEPPGRPGADHRGGAVAVHRGGGEPREGLGSEWSEWLEWRHEDTRQAMDDGQMCWVEKGSRHL